MNGSKLTKCWVYQAQKLDFEIKSLLGKIFGEQKAN